MSDEEKTELVKSMTGKITDLESSKEILKSTADAPIVESEAVDLSQEKEMILNFIPTLAMELNNEITFQVLHEKTMLDFTTIKDALTQLIIEKKVTGFINDSGTAEDLTDDILIIRDIRFVDHMEPKYEIKDGASIKKVDLDLEE
ncbi:MAG: hypothetical protein ACXAD7_11515 [Candidatus Kariarchaeaceae archaeon]|jgi:hypothetical protein